MRVSTKSLFKLISSPLLRRRLHEIIQQKRRLVWRRQFLMWGSSDVAIKVQLSNLWSARPCTYSKLLIDGGKMVWNGMHAVIGNEEHSHTKPWGDNYISSDVPISCPAEEAQVLKRWNRFSPTTQARNRSIGTSCRLQGGSAVTGEWSVLKADGFVSADYSTREQRIDLLTVIVLGHNLGASRHGLEKVPSILIHQADRAITRASAADLSPGRGDIIRDEMR